MVIGHFVVARRLGRCGVELHHGTALERERVSFPRNLVIQGALILKHDGDGPENV